jgi:hypothetical protein
MGSSEKIQGFATVEKALQADPQNILLRETEPGWRYDHRKLRESHL